MLLLLLGIWISWILQTTVQVTIVTVLPGTHGNFTGGCGVIIIHGTVEALVNGHPQDTKKVSVTGAGAYKNSWSYAATRGVRVIWQLTGVCPATSKLCKCKKNCLLLFGYTVVLAMLQFSHKPKIQGMSWGVTHIVCEKNTSTDNWHQLIVMNSDLESRFRLKYKIQTWIRFHFGCVCLLKVSLAAYGYVRFRNVKVQSLYGG